MGIKRPQSLFVKRCIDELEAKARSKKLTMYMVCKRAGVDYSNYCGYRRETYSPTLMVWGRLHEAVDAYKGEK